MRKLHTPLFLFSILAGVFFVPVYAAENITHYHLDALGSPVAASDTQGNIKWRETYHPYGEKILNEAPAQANERWYTGHPHDDDTGLTYTGARYYDPVIGRFFAIDPKEFSADDVRLFNRYAYANNNPYAFVDPDGASGIFVTPRIIVRPTITPRPVVPGAKLKPLTQATQQAVRSMERASARRAIRLPKRIPGESKQAWLRRMNDALAKQIGNTRGPLNTKQKQPQKLDNKIDPKDTQTGLIFRLIIRILKTLENLGGVSGSTPSGVVDTLPGDCFERGECT